MAFKTIKIPNNGEKITMGSDGKLHVPARPIIPVHRGRRNRAGHLARLAVRVRRRASRRLMAASAKIAWMEVCAGEKAFNQFDNWLPDETVEAFKEYLVGIKGPLTTPVGGGIRSLNVALRQMLDLYVCLRPVRYFKGVPSPGERSRRRSTWSSSARTPRTSTPASNGRPNRPRRKRSSSSCSRR